MSDLAELFARDPLQLSQQDLDVIIQKLREARTAFNLGNARAGNLKPQSAKAKETTSLAAKLNLDLDL